MPTPFFTDTFTDTTGTNITAHTPDTGGTWSYTTGNPGPFIVTAAGRIRNGASYSGTTHIAQTAAVESVSTAGNAVTLTWDLFVASPLASSFFAVGIGATGPTTYAGYEVRADINSNQWQIFKVGDSSPLATAAATFTAGQTYHCHFQVPDSAVSATKTFYVNGVALVSITDTSITTTGRLLLDAVNSVEPTSAYVSTDTTGLHVDNLNLYNSAFAPAIYTTLAPDSAGIVLSPGNQYIVAATSLQWIHTSTTAKFNFTGTSLAATLSLAPLVAGGISAANYPYFNWSIDGGAWQRTQITSSVFTLASSLAAGAHSCEVRFEPIEESNTWAPYSAIQITGWTVDVGSNLSAPTGNASARAKKAMLFGDSITVGAGSSNIALLSYGVLLGHALNAEIGVVAYSGQGWDHAATNGAPDFRSTFAKYDVTHNRLFPTLDYLIVAQGTNYGGGDLSTIIPTQLAAIRTVVGNSTLIAVVLPANGSQLAAITSAVNAYIASAFDKRIILVDLTGRHYGFLSTGGHPAIQYSADGIHPTTEGHAIFAADIAAAISTFEASLNSPSSSRTAGGGLLAGL